MKLKVNKRLMQIGMLCLILSVILVFFIYSTFKKSVEPEARERVAYFKHNIDRGKVINKDDITFKDTPISLVPNTKVKNISEIEGKTLVVNATANDFALKDKFISRGETSVDVKEMFQISLKVEHISTFLGTNIKEGDFYALFYLNPFFNVERNFKVKIVNMIDSTGKLVTESGMAVVDSIIIAVETEEEVKAISQYKRIGTFELIKPSENYWNNFNSEANIPSKDTTTSKDNG